MTASTINREPVAEESSRKELDHLPIRGIKNEHCNSTSWQRAEPPVFTEKTVCPVVSSFSDGQGERGVEIAGLEIYNAGLAPLVEGHGWAVADVALPLTGAETVPPPDPEQDKKFNVKNCARVGTKLGLIAGEMAAQVKEHNGLLVNLGGDHSCAAASISTMVEKYPNLRVIWVDAHADCNTPETSPSGNYHGMVLGHLMGWFEKKLPGFGWFNEGILKEKHVGYVGLRDVDEGEKRLLKDSACTYFTMQSLEETNISKAMDFLIETLDPEGNAPFHISFDVDGADPHCAPGTGTKCEGGLNYSQSLRIVEKIAKTGRLVSLDIMEVNVDMDLKEDPIHGDDPAIDTPYRTVKFALHLIRSALGYVAL